MLCREFLCIARNPAILENLRKINQFVETENLGLPVGRPQFGGLRVHEAEDIRKNMLLVNFNVKFLGVSQVKTAACSSQRHRTGKWVPEN